MKQFIYVIISLLSFGMMSSCIRDGDPDDAPAKRTVLVYMIASNLGGYLQGNINDMVSAASKKNLNGGKLIVFYSNNKDLATLLEIKDNKRDTIGTFQGKSAIDPQTMKEVINYVVTNYQASSYGMVLSSHGTAWMPDGYTSMLRSFGAEVQEDGKNKVMEIDILKDAIPSGLFDFLLFDACSMGSVECMYELKDKADYIVSSASEIWSMGFPFETVLPYLFTSQADLDNVAKGFYEYYRDYPSSDYRNGNVSVTVTGELDNLAAITKEILQGAGEEGVFALDASSLQTLSFLPSSPARLTDFAEMIKHLATDEQYGRFEAALEKAILHPYSTDVIYCTKGGYVTVNTFSGLSVYPMRENLTQLNEWYRTRLSWYAATY